MTTQNIKDLADEYAEAKMYRTTHPKARTALFAAIDALAQDAARYRWIRELPNADSLNVQFMGADLDMVIDEELSKEQT